MEIMNSTFAINPRFSPRNPLLSSNFAICKWRINPPNPRFTLRLRRFRLHPSFSFNSLNPKKSHISAHFNRPTKRINHLRKKLNQQQQQLQVSHPVLELDTVNINHESVFDNSSENFDNLSEFNGSIEESKNFDINYVDSGGGTEELESGLSKIEIGESVKLKELETWVEQYKKDSELWGVGINPIFTVIHDSGDKVEKVVVNKEEIVKRTPVSESEDLAKVKFKISFAEGLANEMENGSNVIPRNSTVAKFMLSGENPKSQSGFMDSIRGVTVKSDSLSRMTKVGVFLLCGLFVVSTVKRLLSGIVKEDKEEEYTSLEKEMLRRKIKSRNEKDKLEKGSVEVLPESVEPRSLSFGRPQVNKEELMSSINNAKGSVKYSSYADEEFEDKINEIRTMARHARETEKQDSLTYDSDEEDEESLDDIAADDLVVDTSLKLSSPNNTTSSRPSEVSLKPKFRIIKSVEEAKEYLSRKNEKPEVHHEVDVRNGQTFESSSISGGPEFAGHSEKYDMDRETTRGLNGFEMPKVTLSSEVSDGNQDTSTPKFEIPEEVQADKEDNEEKETLTGFQIPKAETCSEVSDGTKESSPSETKGNWLENNFHELEPLVKKIGVGYRDNYKIAREKANQELVSETEYKELNFDGDESEYEWMKDENLRNIVFRVRDNELSGRDPFHLMSEEDKSAFYGGLEKKVEQTNEQLLHLHEYLHSNIENLDYGTDGISVYDPPEKIIPRWKNPPVEKSPEFLNNFEEQRKMFVSESLKKSFSAKKNGKKETSLATANVSDERTKLHKEPVSSKTSIQGSDGSVRAGRKNGKEFWEHTKKWSQGFIDSYNAETDPEIKSTMKDMGKDLDRWITEKEIKEAAELMDKIPEKGQKFIKDKLDKVKRDMERFGPQAVVSKYSEEYADNKKEDYLWWLDLPFVLCIELYTVENGEQKMGFYSLEMAPDLEMNPKQHHVIAFEDAGDCKNLCYIIQAHMELLGNGNAFVVARPPKDTYREAKENGFSVTVIRKGQLQLNIDQTLEEVDELIIEIGSKVYHDKIMKERSVDINGLMKGVFGFSKPTKGRKRTKRKLKRLGKQP